MAYQPEYLQLRGLMDQLRKTAAEIFRGTAAGWVADKTNGQGGEATQYDNIS
jgi:hypothetical protein